MLTEVTVRREGGGNDAFARWQKGHIADASTGDVWNWGSVSKYNRNPSGDRCRTEGRVVEKSSLAP